MVVTIARILFPTDFSELSLHALNHARLFADRFDAQLHCLHVVDEACQYWSTMGPESIPIGPPPQEILDFAKNRMTRFKTEQLQGLKHDPTTVIVQGRPFMEIVTYAREQSIDLIVMGTHGRGAIAHMLLGSTTEKVVRKAGCAVLTVRAAGQGFQVP